MKKNPSPKKGNDRKIAWLAAEHMANVMMLASAWAEALGESVASTDNELLGALEELLADYGDGSYSESSQEKYLELRKKILLLRAKGFQSALEFMTKQSEALAANEAKWAQSLTKQTVSGKLNPVGKGRISAVVKYADVEEGMTLEESIRAAAEEDAKRISEICRSGVRKGKSIQDISKEIRGTREGNYEDGVLNVSRTEAQQIARTGCCAIADEAKMQFYLANEDVIRGVRHVATLSGNTCLVCGSLDGTVWILPEEAKKIVSLPIHPNCRCVHLPVTDLDEINSSTRPAEAIDFWKEAEKQYEKDHPGKHWRDLARSTKLKYYYKAQKDYEARTGKPAFEQVPQNMSFEDWLKTKDEAYKEAWFGKTRYPLYKEGKLPLKKFINPQTNTAFSVRELKRLDLEAIRQTDIDFNPNNLMEIRREITPDEIAPLRRYTCGEDNMYSRINEYLRSDGTMPKDKTLDGMIQSIRSAISASELKDDTVVFRGIRSEKIFDLIRKKGQKEFPLDSFKSTSLSRNVSSQLYAGHIQDESIMLKILLPKGTHCLDVSRISAAKDKEDEILLPDVGKFVVKGVSYNEITGQLDVEAEYEEK